MSECMGSNNVKNIYCSNAACRVDRNNIWIVIFSVYLQKLILLTRLKTLVYLTYRKRWYGICIALGWVYIEVFNPYFCCIRKNNRHLYIRILPVKKDGIYKIDILLRPYYNKMGFLLVSSNIYLQWYIVAVTCSFKESVFSPAVFVSIIKQSAIAIK